MNSLVVLVVDIDSYLRANAAAALRGAKFGVLLAASPAEAHMSHTHDVIDILLTEAELGKGCMTGFELAALVVREHPSTRAVVMSEKSENESPARDLGHGFLAKPFTPIELVQRTSESLRLPAKAERRTNSGAKAG
jgi:CheY-like chemotaxis protein